MRSRFQSTVVYSLVVLMAVIGIVMMMGLDLLAERNAPKCSGSCLTMPASDTMKEG